MCWVSTTCFNSTAVEAEGIYDKNMRRKFIVIGEIFFPEFIITFFKKYISGKIFPSQLILRMRKMRECTKKCHIICIPIAYVVISKLVYYTCVGTYNYTFKSVVFESVNDKRVKNSFVRIFENYTFESIFFKSVEIESVVVSAHPQSKQKHCFG